MGITRKVFCTSVAYSTLTLWLQGCGGGGGYDSPAAPPPAGSAVCGASAANISDNHGHTLSIAKADLDSAVDKTYTLSPSTEGHVHSVSFTVAQLAVLKAGGSVMVTSTSTAASAVYGGTHSHTVNAAVSVANCP